MGVEVNQLLMGLMGGGLVALIPVIVNAIRQLSKGRLAKEETVIIRWKNIADEKEEEADRAWRMVNAFRKWYHLLWVRYVRISGDEESFPADPIQYEKNLRKEEHERGTSEGKNSVPHEQSDV